MLKLIKIYLKEAITFFRSVNKPAKASIAFTICNIIQKCLSAITLPLFTRLLTPAQYGVLAVYNSWYSIIQVFATLNIFLAFFNKGIIKFEKDKDRFHSSMLGLTTTLTLIISVIYICFSDNLNQYLNLSTCLMFVMLLQLLFTPAFSFWSARQRFSFEYKNLVIITLFISIISPLFAFIAVINTEYKAEARVIAYESIAILIGIYFYITTFIKNKTFFNKKYWLFALSFNLPLIFHYLSRLILDQSDRIMINNMIGSSEAAIYSVAYNLSFMTSMITTSINNSLVPFTYRKIKDNNFESLNSSINHILYLISFCIGLIILFGPEIILIFATNSYYNAIWIIPPVSISVLINFIYSFFVNVEFYFEKSKAIAFASCIISILNIGLNYIFLPKFGYLAAGYTTLICYLFLMFFHYLVYKKILKEKKIEKIYDTSNFWKMIIIISITMFVILNLYNHLVIRYSIIIIMFAFLFYKKKSIIAVIKSLKE